MSREPSSGDQPIYPPKGEMVEVPRRSIVDSGGRLPGAVRAVRVELIGAEKRGGPGRGRKRVTEPLPVLPEAHPGKVAVHRWRDSVVKQGRPKKGFRTEIVLPEGHPGDVAAHRWRGQGGGGKQIVVQRSALPEGDPGHVGLAMKLVLQ